MTTNLVSEIAEILADDQHPQKTDTGCRKLSFHRNLPSAKRTSGSNRDHY